MNYISSHHWLVRMSFSLFTSVIGKPEEKHCLLFSCRLQAFQAKRQVLGKNRTIVKKE